MRLFQTSDDDGKKKKNPTKKKPTSKTDSRRPHLLRRRRARRERGPALYRAVRVLRVGVPAPAVRKRGEEEVFFSFFSLSSVCAQARAHTLFLSSLLRTSESSPPLSLFSPRKTKKTTNRDRQKKKKKNEKKKQGLRRQEDRPREPRPRAPRDRRGRRPRTHPGDGPGHGGAAGLDGRGRGGDGGRRRHGRPGRAGGRRWAAVGADAVQGDGLGQGAAGEELAQVVNEKVWEVEEMFFFLKTKRCEKQQILLSLFFFFQRRRIRLFSLSPIRVSRCDRARQHRYRSPVPAGAALSLSQRRRCIRRRRRRLWRHQFQCLAAEACGARRTSAP